MLQELDTDEIIASYGNEDDAYYEVRKLQNHAESLESLGMMNKIITFLKENKAELLFHITDKIMKSLTYLIWEITN